MATESGGSIGRSDVDAARNRSFGAGLVDDPYPTYHRLIEQCAVLAGGISEHFGIPVIDAFAASPQSFTALGYRSVVDVLRDDRTYSNEWYAPSLNMMIGPNMLGMDAPAHKRQRLLLQSAFSKREMRWWRTDIVQPIVNRAVDAIVQRGHADLYADLAAFIPARVIVDALGLPEKDLAQFFEWAIVMTSSVEPPERRLAAADGMAEYISPLCEARRAKPTRDLISILVNAVVDDADLDEGDEVDRHPLSVDEINGFVRLLLVGGTSTTHRAFGMLLYLLLTNPDQLAMLRADRSLAANAIEESLRLEQPLVSWGRLTTRDTDLAGVRIPAGCPVNVNVGAANHDPAEWPEPDRFDIMRAHPDRHLTFGFGKHHCLGVHLARMELDVMLAAVLDRFPDLRLDTTTDVGLTGLGFRMVNQLPCTWSVG